MTATTTPTPTTNSSTPKVDVKKALAKVLARQRAKDQSGILVGTVVATGPDVEEATPGRVARGVAMTGRVIRGIWTAGPAFRDWRLATEFDSKVAALEASGDHAKAVVTLTAQLAESEKRRARAAKIGEKAAIAAAPVIFGGWFWATLILFAAMIGSLALLRVKAMHGKVVAWLAGAFGLSLLLEVIQAALGVHPSPVALSGVQTTMLIAVPASALVGVIFLFDKVSMKGVFACCGAAEVVALIVCLSGLRAAWSWAYLVPPLCAVVPTLIYAVVWAIKATKDDGTIRDNLGSALVSADVERDARPEIIKAIISAGALPKETVPALVQPGIMPGNNGMIWTATVETGGPSGTALLTPRAHAELAAHLGLSTRRLILTVDEDRGSRLHLTGIVGQPWQTLRHPLLSGEPVDLWDGIRFGPTIEGDVVNYRVFEANSLFGGESGSGKSTALAGIWSAFAMSPTSTTYAIDGGEVDTEPLRRSGLAEAWTTDLAEGIDVLKFVRAEVDRRQHLLAQAELRKVSPEFFAAHGLGFMLLLIDELATYTQGTGKPGQEFADCLRPILQRSRKVGIHVVLSTQSPSVDAIDGDARDVLPVRWCGRARTVALGNKVLGAGAAGRGLSPLNLPDSDDARGVGWYSAPGREVQMRPYGLEDADLKAICARALELRRGAITRSAADDDRTLVASVVKLIKTQGKTAGGRQVMRLRDVAVALEMDPMALRKALADQGIGTQIVRRTDSVDDDNRAHYVLDDFPSALASLL